MNKQEAKNIIIKTFESPFIEERFIYFIKNLLNNLDDSESIKKNYFGNLIPDSFADSIKNYKRIGQYKDSVNNVIDILIVNLKRETTLERARTLQRNFIARHLKKRNHEAALAAFYTEGVNDWRFSFIKLEYNLQKKDDEKVQIYEDLTPAKRYSFLVGVNEKSHTAQNQFVNLLIEKETKPTLKRLEEAFDIETVTKEFFDEYRSLFIRTKESLDKVIDRDPKLKIEFDSKGVSSVDFSKKLLGQIIFLYFLQKKGWFGVGRDSDWGTGSKKFLRELLEKKHSEYKNFFKEILEPLFYEVLRYDRQDFYYSRFNCKIPFLNGGLFDPICNYDWIHTDITLPNELFFNTTETHQGDIGDGIFDIFDRYNFTVIEDEPLEKEVAIDPELLGKAYEKFNAIRLDNFDEYIKSLKSGKKGDENKFNKQYGVYYTPREIVHYMCRESLINYLTSKFESNSITFEKMGDSQLDLLGNASIKGQLNLETEYKSNLAIPRKYFEILINYGELLGENDAAVEAKGKETDTYFYKLPEIIRTNAKLIDDKLADILVCDPAVGSGAFPVGMMHEIVTTRNLLSIFINDDLRSIYIFKRECIEKSLYGVDIDSGAVEIAKLRLWLSLVVDEDDINNIKPLPNLDYKIVCGNSLIGVEYNLFNNEFFEQLENLKPFHLNETNPTKKQIYKKQIDELILKITNGHNNFDFKVYFSEVFHLKEGFDIVISNPPYIGEKGHKEIFRVMRNTSLNKFYKRKMDYFYFFFHLALNLTHNNSIITFISTNYFVTSDSAINLRRDIKNRSSVISMINFNELKLFESALGQHNIITILVTGKNEIISANFYNTNRISFATSDVLTRILNGSDSETTYFSSSQDKVFEGENLYIRINNTPHQNIIKLNNILSKICINSIPLIKISNINQGILTGLDKITNKHLENNLISPTFKNYGVYVLNKEEIENLNLNKKELKILKPWFKNSDISKYWCNINPNSFLIYATRNLNIDNFPNIFSHFTKFEIPIKARSQERGEIQAALKLGKWWVVFAARSESIFENEKLICPQRSYTNCFAYNNSSWFASADVYFITRKDDDYKLKYILALLNSKLYYLWLFNRGKRKGNMLELYYTPLTQIPIRIINPKQQQLFIILVDKILKAKQQYPQTNTKHLEDQIDIMVYKLYDLTYEEVEIIDPEIGKIISKAEYEKYEIK